MWWLIPVGIVLLLALILISSVHIIADYRNELKLYLRFWFVKINLSDKLDADKQPKKKKKKKKQAQKKQASGTGRAKKEKSLLRNALDTDGIAGVLELLADIVEMARNATGYMRRHIIIRRLYVKLRVTGEDAAKTALQYGGMCAAVYPLVAMLQSVMKVKKSRTDIKADYLGTATTGELTAHLSVRVIAAIVILFQLGFQYSKFQTRHGPKKPDSSGQNTKTTEQTEKETQPVK